MNTTDPQRRTRSCHKNKRAITPVIGIILLVAIAVILAAVIGTFALGMGDRVQDSAPSTRFSFDYKQGDPSGVCTNLSDDDGTDEGKVTITHQAGDKIRESQLTIIDDEGNRASWDDCAFTDVTEISSGDQTAPEIDADDTVRLVWVSENDEDDTAVIATYKGPDA